MHKSEKVNLLITPPRLEFITEFKTGCLNNDENENNNL